MNTVQDFLKLISPNVYGIVIFTILSIITGYISNYMDNKHANHHPHRDASIIVWGVSCFCLFICLLLEYTNLIYLVSSMSGLEQSAKYIAALIEGTYLGTVVYLSLLLDPSRR